MAYTDACSSLRKLTRQRYRWYLGGLDILSKFGWNKATRSDIFDHCLFFTLLGTIVATILLVGHGSFQLTAWSLIPIGFAVFGWIRNMYCLKLVQNLEKKDIFLRAILIPELAYSMFLSAIQMAAYLSKAITRKRVW
jgi:cellulose synthase/poly-beta-1,6-N-acetylglucosamine synthase-like glycosyltransferase